MKKNRGIVRISSLIVLIAVLAWTASILLKKRGKSDGASFDFRIEDTTQISSIEIRDAFGQDITLSKQGQAWVDEKGQCVSAPNVSFILEAANLIEFKGYIAEKSKKHFVNLMSTQHIRVRFFVDGSWVKTWYIGPPAQDHYGQIMLLESEENGLSSEPVMMRIRGLNGIISPRFFADRKKWMCTGIFALTPEQIASVELINMEHPELSFQVKTHGRGFKVISQGKELPFLDTANVYRYLQEFRNVHFNTANLELSKTQVDSVKRSVVYCTLMVTTQQGKSTKLRFHRIKSTDLQRNELGDLVPWDMNLLWAELPSGELVKCQYFVFNPLFMGHVYFPGIMERK
ncbi:MAG: hypothetical protein EBS17_00415 [Flavobacteriia bacterium]|nr:hypothetical protein [Flavobacteriia bacterium]